MTEGQIELVALMNEINAIDENIICNRIGDNEYFTCMDTMLSKRYDIFWMPKRASAHYKKSKTMFEDLWNGGPPYRQELESVIENLTKIIQIFEA